MLYNNSKLYSSKLNYLDYKTSRLDKQLSKVMKLYFNK